MASLGCVGVLGLNSISHKWYLIRMHIWSGYITATTKTTITTDK